MASYFKSEEVRVITSSSSSCRESSCFPATTELKRTREKKGAMLHGNERWIEVEESLKFTIENALIRLTIRLDLLTQIPMII